MAKKTSRSARALQTQRSVGAGGERKNAVRPLIDTGSSRLIPDVSGLAVDTSQFEGPTEDLATDELNPKETETVETRPLVRETQRRSAREDINRPMTQETTSTTTIRPATSRRPYGRRTTVATNKQPTLTREEEYSFIRSDLITVFVLTVLMIVALIVLTFVLPG